MKKSVSFLLAVLLTAVSVQLQSQVILRPDGGLKIGKPPTNWRLTNKGLEVSVGNILFHTPEQRYLEISNQSVSVNSGPLSSFVEATALTGTLLSIGTSSNYAYSVFSTNIASRTPVSISSDRRYKENIADIPDSREKVLQLRPVSYDLKTPVDYWGDTMCLKNKVGFIAQEVQPLFPHLVGYIADADQYTLDYTSLIPYLTQVIQLQEQELQGQKEEIAALTDRMAELERMLTELLPSAGRQGAPRQTAENENAGNTVSSARLYQNIPNPFSQRTLIRYELPRAMRNAYIHIHDAHGRNVKSETLPQMAGKGQIEISGGELSPGTYTYSLVIAGKTADTKRMIVTE